MSKERRNIRDDIPVPPNPKQAAHHWLEQRDCDGHAYGLVVLQWNPVAALWIHSGLIGSGTYVDTKHWLYVAPCPLPTERL